MRRHFKPELLNRLDEIVVFDPLSRDQLRKVARLHLKDLTNVSTEISKAGESSKIVEASGETVQKVVEFNFIDKVRKEKTGKKQTKVDWDNLRLQAEGEQKREKTQDTMDSLDYEALRNADVSEVADAIKERGMNNVLAARIKVLIYNSTMSIFIFLLNSKWPFQLKTEHVK